jgi:TRAP-type C4-dicarboxylate transport system permease small subunit
MILEDEEVYFGNLLAQQREAVHRCRYYCFLLLAVGIVLLVGSSIGWLIMWRKYPELGGTSLIQVSIPAGAGLMTTAASLYPIKEITNRKQKILTYESLLSQITSARNATKNRTVIERIQKKVRMIEDQMLKEC